MVRLGDQSDSGHKRGDVDMTSMVDVTFLLLIFFMVTASFRLQKALAVPAQQSEDAGRVVERPEIETVSVQVDSRGSCLVMTPQWEREAFGKQQLVAALKDANAESSEERRLSVLVHEMARLDALVDVLDAAATSGFVDLQVTQVEDF